MLSTRQITEFTAMPYLLSFFASLGAFYAVEFHFRGDIDTPV
jgi:hypothetical protein